jgi:hypothetical protein
MKFPRVIRHRKAECKIYGKKPNYPFYRVSWYVTGQRRVKQFATYSKVKEFTDALVKDLAKGSQRTAFTPAQAIDALAAFERLQASASAPSVMYRFCGPSQNTSIQPSS